jgi:hypothetical protein
LSSNWRTLRLMAIAKDAYEQTQYSFDVLDG